MANWRGNALRFCEVAGLPILEPFVRLAAGEDPKEQMKGIAKFLLVPLAAIGIFIACWSAAAKVVVTDSMQLPSPAATWTAGKDLFALHSQQRQADRAKKTAKLKEAVTLMARAMAIESKVAVAAPDQQDALLASALHYKKRAVAAANYTPSSAPTFVDQIVTSLKTVFFGFAIATIVAVPVGVLCGTCPHKKAFVLSRGIIGDAGGVPKVACPLHKKAFSLQSGKCISGEEYQVDVFPVKVDNGTVYLELPPTDVLDEIHATEIGCKLATTCGESTMIEADPEVASL